MNVSGVFLEPFANIGISDMFIPFPPTPGTQSGTFTLFNPRITVLTADIMPLITPVHTDLIPCQIPENICFMPSQACRQFPENTPVMKVIIPFSTVAIPEITPEIAWTPLCTIDWIVGITNCIAAKIPWIIGETMFQIVVSAVCIAGKSVCNTFVTTGKIAWIAAEIAGSTVLQTKLNNSEIIGKT